MNVLVVSMVFVAQRGCDVMLLCYHQVQCDTGAYPGICIGGGQKRGAEDAEVERPKASRGKGMRLSLIHI